MGRLVEMKREIVTIVYSVINHAKSSAKGTAFSITPSRLSRILAEMGVPRRGFVRNFITMVLKCLAIRHGGLATENAVVMPRNVEIDIDDIIACFDEIYDIIVEKARIAGRR